MQVIFAFMVQVSNFSATSSYFDYSYNCFFMILSICTIIVGIDIIAYDYKTDRTITYNCYKGKYRII